ncbi:hypothetical protein [Aureimonas sp. AU40]|uniref:hypothetical protein n=1 Tax=Aureimonas sp. AU40 TaxID=1637747 RepID=UPI000A45BE1A|nr:hypothetical protein [Aureimonas sp. AU40]
MSNIVDHKLASSSNALLAEFFATQSKEMDPDSPSYLGFRIVGPALLAFFNWISDEAEVNKIDRILFFNEGLMNSYNFYLSQTINSFPKISSSSIISSKKSKGDIFLAGITEGNFEKKFIPIFSRSDQSVLPTALEVLGIRTPTLYVLNETGVVGSDYGSSHNSRAIELFLQAWRSQIVKEARNERRNLLQSLLASGIEDGQRLAVIDLGFDGILQENFKAAIENTIVLDVFGFNFALNDSVDSKNRMRRSRMSGLLDSRNTRIDDLRSLEMGAAAFEAFFESNRPKKIDLFDLSVSEAQNSRDIQKGVENFLKAFLKQQQPRSLHGMVLELTRPLINHISG